MTEKKALGHQNVGPAAEEHKYRLAYSMTLLPGEHTKAELTEQELGGTDFLLLVSMLFTEDGGASVLWDARDGRKPPECQAGLPDVIRAWVMMGMALSNRIQAESPDANALALVTQLPLRLLMDQAPLEAVGEALQQAMGIDPDDPMGDS